MDDIREIDAYLLYKEMSGVKMYFSAESFGWTSFIQQAKVFNPGEKSRTVPPNDASWLQLTMAPQAQEDSEDPE